MSVTVRNGKAEMERKPKGLDAPTPSQIAERAYALATDVACSDDTLTHDQADMLRGHMNEHRAATLKGLRESVINPGPIPWWRHLK